MWLYRIIVKFNQGPGGRGRVLNQLTRADCGEKPLPKQKKLMLPVMHQFLLDAATVTTSFSSEFGLTLVNCVTDFGLPAFFVKSEARATKKATKKPLFLGPIPINAPVSQRECG